MNDEENDPSASLLPVDPLASPPTTEPLPHESGCAVDTCRWCEQHETTHDQTGPSCEFSPRACNCKADYAAARERTPGGGYTVAEWMDEMTEQHTAITAAMRALLEELKRCHESGASFDFLSELVTQAYDTVGVIRVTPDDLDAISGSGNPAANDHSDTPRRSAAP